MFEVELLDPEIVDVYDQLFGSTVFELIRPGRYGAVLVEVIGGPSDKRIPIVRTTTQYRQPAQKFNDVHKKIAAKLEHPYNNALIEVYTPEYKTMGFHSDQALDLADNSFISIYSCYANPDYPDRKLTIKCKRTGAIREILLVHNSVVTFSTNINSEYLHKISGREGNTWLGITFRLSKTFYPSPYLHLRLATESERKNFLKLRSAENKTIGFVYPDLPYTISESDLLPV